MLVSRIRAQAVGSLVMAAALGFAVAGLPAVGEPEIGANQTSMGFGSVPDDRPLEHCFVIENKGDSPLLIDRVTGDCEGCLSISLETNAIAPGRSAIVEMTLDTGLLEGDFAKNLFLRTNDPKRPVLILSLWGTVVPRYIVRPRSVVFEMAAKMNAVTQVVSIVNKAGSPERLSLVACSTGNFTGTVLPGLTAETCELRVSTVPPLPDGLTCGDIILSSSNPAAPRCVVRVAAYVPPAFVVLPARLIMKSTEEEQTRIIFVRQNSSKPARLMDVVLPSKGFLCEINPGPGPADYRIYVRARGLAGKQGLAGNLVLKTDDPSHAEVNVPIEVR